MIYAFVLLVLAFWLACGVLEIALDDRWWHDSYAWEFRKPIDWRSRYVVECLVLGPVALGVGQSYRKLYDRWM